MIFTYGFVHSRGRTSPISCSPRARIAAQEKGLVPNGSADLRCRKNSENPAEPVANGWLIKERCGKKGSNNTLKITLAQSEQNRISITHKVKKITWWIIDKIITSTPSEQMPCVLLNHLWQVHRRYHWIPTRKKMLYSEMFDDFSLSV